MKNDNYFTVSMIMILALASFISTKTNSQTTIKVKVDEKIKPLEVKPLPKIDTIVSKIDTVNKEQLKTREILSATKVQTKDNIKKNTEINNFIKEAIKEDKKVVVVDTTVIVKVDTLVVAKVVVKEVVKEKVIHVDTTIQEKTFLQRIFKFLPFKKRRE